MHVVDQFTTPPHACPYLADQIATTEYRLVQELSPAEYEACMDAGCRKFGVLVFRPVCAGCSECRPIRIDVTNFSPNRSQRRNWERHRNLEVRRQPPVLDRPRWELFKRYHAGQAERKGWHDSIGSPPEYRAFFLNNPLPALEISLWDGGDLLGITLTEVTPNTVSGIYHYHDPARAQLGLGTNCMLQTIALARDLGKPWAYFGYHVTGCGSLAYKARFRPCQRLETDGNWCDFSDQGCV